MALGDLIRQRRESLKMTLDELGKRTGSSKPYLSTVENNKTKHPPSDALLTRIESVLGFEPSELLHIAHMQRLPAAVRKTVETTVAENEQLRGWLHRIVHEGIAPQTVAQEEAFTRLVPGTAEPNAEPVPVAGKLVPIINRVSAGYPVDFDDLDYPTGIAEDYVRCPDLHDPHAFAVRVVGDSMEPRYRQGDVVIFSPARQVENGDDCFVRLCEPHETTFKRIFFDDENTIRLQPNNPIYSPLILPRQRINGLWKAVIKYERL